MFTTGLPWLIAVYEICNLIPSVKFLIAYSITYSITYSTAHDQKLDSEKAL